MNEKIKAENQSQEILRIDLRKYAHIEQKLEDKYGQQIEIDRGDNNLTNERNISHFIYQFPKDVLKNYIGHGGVRDVSMESALSILDNWVAVGDAAPLSTEGYISAYTNGSYLLLSERKKPLEIGKRTVEIDGAIRGAAILAPEAVFVCNVEYDSIVEELRKLYPERKILRASEVGDYIRSQETMASPK